MPRNLPKALGFAALLWLTGFIWGSFVFMSPAFKATAPIPYVSSNPWISFPILLVWPVLAWWLARNYLRAVPDPNAEGPKLGLVFAGLNLLLDLLVLVILLAAGWTYFGSATVWIGYAILLFVPWQVGRSAAQAPSR
jgi:hypothetical protein